MRKALGLCLILSQFFIVALAQANSCDQQLQLARRTGQAQLVVSFEGLLGQELFASPLRRQISPVMKGQGQVPYISHGCTTFIFAKLEQGCQTQVQQAHQCLMKFKRVFGSRLKVSVLGHSFGGSYGVMNFLKAAERSGVFIDQVVTMDARTHHDDRATFGKSAPDPSMYRYSKPANVGRFVNLYQCSGLRGYLVKGATNINTCGSASHMSIVSHGRAQSAIHSALYGNSATARVRAQKAEDEASVSTTVGTTRRVFRPVREIPIWQTFESQR